MPSASTTYGPTPETMKRGVPPTALNARTGELTPPGVTASARANHASEAGAVAKARYGRVTRPSSQPADFLQTPAGGDTIVGLGSETPGGQPAREVGR